MKLFFIMVVVCLFGHTTYGSISSSELVLHRSTLKRYVMFVVVGRRIMSMADFDMDELTERLANR